MSESFDYILVGGGTAGLTLASRLTEDPSISVLVVEAGADHTKSPLVLTPGLVGAQYGQEDYDWNFNSVPQRLLHNRRVNTPRGKQLGGSSALNFMMLVYPSRHSLDTWAKLGNEGWDYDGLAPYLAKFATVHAPPSKAREAVGLTWHDGNLTGDGPVHVSFSEGYGPNNKAWLDAFEKHGLAMTGDMRDGAAYGAYQQPASIDPKDKTRSFAGTAYYGDEVRSRKNLTVLTETLVHKVVFDTAEGSEPRATGVLVSDKEGNKKTISTSGEVIVCAGALQSPQILELSGIGQKKLLDALDIPVLVENESVGENLQDHPIVCQSFEVADGIVSGDVIRDPEVLNMLLGQYNTSREGPMGQSNISVAQVPLADASGVMSADKKKALFASKEGLLTDAQDQAIRALYEDTNEPIVEYMLFPSQVDTTLAEPASMASYLMPTRPENSITIMTLHNHPFSRGSVHITSPDAGQKPAWDPNYSANALDIEIVSRHIQFVETLVETSPLKEMIKPGGRRFPDVKGDTMENCLEIIRRTQLGDFHPACSCAMKPKEHGGVVDARLRVYGTRGLRVVDASIFPIEPVGNIQTTVYAVAEKAADLIKEDRKA
ncbi:uncharacterized protein F5Z01DRAFT_127773 [Emericellopsis atlantica]|uniref:Glucose-methanol-choline oxidoreductase N-terminal domain-containing protein n=1 Tax=Emericellopsis atlantica TaxID=2614577 RepID=A0A9P8CP32_9HYPO|nr:uncharacterized protein F5Z01DRAFT_127773 [Emericellopsis atlantica]KAG9253767.1 hypothetical protein F5Z01DRAFT_127773 [Emericellopsis atlantica]